MNEVILLLGSNMEDRLQMITHAEEQIKRRIGRLLKQSKIYETASWGKTDLQPFLNKVIEVETKLLPTEVMATILLIEESLGRVRVEKWEARTIDIDILFYDNVIMELPYLVIPHPLLHKRRFTLVPLVEIHPDKQHPVLNKTCLQLLLELEDNLPVKVYNRN